MSGALHELSTFRFLLATWIRHKSIVVAAYQINHADVF